MAATLVDSNKQMADMLVNQSNPRGIEVYFKLIILFFFPGNHKTASHVSESLLWELKLPFSELLFISFAFKSSLLRF